jgi:hypothetical protein
MHKEVAPKGVEEGGHELDVHGYFLVASVVGKALGRIVEGKEVEIGRLVQNKGQRMLNDVLLKAKGTE